MSFMPAQLPPGPSTPSSYGSQQQQHQYPQQHQQPGQGAYHSPFQRATSGDITHLPGQRAQTVCSRLAPWLGAGHLACA